MRALLSFSVVLSLGLPAFAAGPISADAHITDILVAARVGDVIRTTCPSISARYFVVLSKMDELKSYAVGQGYSEDEVKAFLKDKDQKARIHGLADAYLAKAGAKDGDVESYCQAGRDEIAKGTLAGSLLRSWK